MSNAAMTRRTAVAGLTAAAIAAKPSAAAAQAPPSRHIEIAAKPLARFSRTSNDNRFGQLTFRGGLTLTSSDKDFGGLSGLALEANGRTFVAISDEGSWLTGDIVEKDGRPLAIEGARIGAIRAPNGIPYQRKRDKDCEAVAILDGDLNRGTLLMAFERNHRIERFPVRERVVQSSAGALPMPQDAARMEANKGLEAMTVLAGGPHRGAVVAFSERLPDADGNHTGWLWVDGAPQRIALTALGGFDVTDAASLPDGSLVILERRFRWSEGVKMQLRLVAATEIAPGRVAAGAVLFTADNGHEIDNMEGLAVHREVDGTTILTVVSDDNFNHILQRTILLRFALGA